MADEPASHPAVDEGDAVPVSVAFDRSLPLDANGRLAVDVPCLGCRYNLRGISPDGTCPECGQSVYDSTGSDRLHRSADWLKKVVDGFDLVVFGLFLGLLMFVFAFGVAVGMGPSDGMLALIIWIMGMVPGLVIYAGCLKITHPEPLTQSPTPMQVRGEVPRMATRAMAHTVVFLASLTGPAVLVMGIDGGVFAAFILFLLGVFAATAGGLSALRYGEVLARRIPDDSLAGSARGLLISYVVLFAMLGLAIVIPAGFDGAPSNSLGALISVIACLFLIAVPIIALWTLVLFFLFRSQLANAGKGWSPRQTQREASS